MTDPDFPYGVTLPWYPDFKSEAQWEEVACWAIEVYGLPGSRFVTDVNINDMTWWFRDPEDRTFFILKNGRRGCTQLEYSHTMLDKH